MEIEFNERPPHLYYFIDYISNELINIKNNIDFEKTVRECKTWKYGFDLELFFIYDVKFKDLPFEGLIAVKDEPFTKVYKYSLKIYSKIFDLIYLETVQGPFFIINLIDDEIGQRILRLLEYMNHIRDRIEPGIFFQKKSNNFIKICYDDSFDMYLAFISQFEILFDHPWYFQGVVIDHLLND